MLSDLHSSALLYSGIVIGCENTHQGFNQQVVTVCIMPLTLLRVCCHGGRAWYFEITLFLTFFFGWSVGWSVGWFLLVWGFLLFHEVCNSAMQQKFLKITFSSFMPSFNLCIEFKLIKVCIWHHSDSKYKIPTAVLKVCDSVKLQG